MIWSGHNELILTRSCNVEIMIDCYMIPFQANGLPAAGHKVMTSDIGLATKLVGAAYWPGM